VPEEVEHVHTRDPGKEEKAPIGMGPLFLHGRHLENGRPSGGRDRGGQGCGARRIGYPRGCGWSRGGSERREDGLKHAPPGADKMGIPVEEVEGHARLFAMFGRR
jgi:hypothetical protein